MESIEQRALSARALAGIALLALALRLSMTLAAAREPQRCLREDSGVYLALSHSMRTRGSFSSNASNAPELMRTPGYPAFLAAVESSLGESEAAVAAVQAALGAATAVLTALVAAPLAGEGAAVCAGLAVALDPPSITHASLVLSETLFTLILLGACALVLGLSRGPSAGRALAAGLAVSAANLVRPVGLYVVPLMALGALAVTLAARERLVRSLALALIVALASLVGPAWWIAHNAATAGTPVFTVMEGHMWVCYKAAGALSLATGRSWDDCYVDLGRQLDARAGPAGYFSPDYNAVARQLAFEVLAAHPAATLAMLAGGAARMWLGPGGADLLILVGATRPVAPSPWPDTGPAAARVAGGTLLVLATLYRIVAIAAMLIGIVLWCARPCAAAETGFVLLLLAYFTLASASPGAYARFRVPVTPLASIPVGIALDAWRVRRSRARSNPVGAPDNPGAPGHVAP